jgi:tRNA(fMet)-specific endonuclease VapC
MRSGEMRLKFERLAFDSNAAIALLRPERPTPSPFAEAARLVMPLFVLAELELGASRQRVKTTDSLTAFVAACTILAPDRDTVPLYVDVRNEMLRGHTLPASAEEREGLHHDIWIAALCIQHGLPLLTNDRDMRRVSALKAIQW